eukprot:s2144_g2.t1
MGQNSGSVQGDLQFFRHGWSFSNAASQASRHGQRSDLARSAAEAPRMGGLALVKSGDEVLRRLGITNDFEASTDWLLRLSALHLFIAAVALAAQPQVAQLEVNHD